MQTQGPMGEILSARVYRVDIFWRGFRFALAGVFRGSGGVRRMRRASSSRRRSASSGGNSSDSLERFMDRDILAHPDAKYYARFGQFLHFYAMVETSLHTFCRQILATDERVASAITGGMRTGDLMSLIKRILKARSFPDVIQQFVERLFTHINDISILRDSLVHRGAKIEGNEIISSSELTAKSIEDIQVLKANFEDIDSAILDCIQIYVTIEGSLADPQQIPTY